MKIILCVHRWGLVGEDEEWKVLYEMDSPPASDTLEIPNLIPLLSTGEPFTPFLNEKTTFPST